MAGDEDEEQIDVASIRRRLGLSQAEFAARFGVSLGTIRGWEQGRRIPPGPARALLKVISSEPDAADRAQPSFRRTIMQLHEVEKVSLAARHLVRIVRDPQPKENQGEAVAYLRGMLPALRQHPDLVALADEVEDAVAQAPANLKLVGVVEIEAGRLYAVVEFLDLAVAWHSPTAMVEITDPRFDPPMAPVHKSQIRAAFANQLDPNHLPKSHYLGRIRS